MATGKDGAHSSQTHTSQKNSWTEPHKGKIQYWCHQSQHQCKETSLAQHVNTNSTTEPSKPPYRMYLRPSGHTFGATQQYTNQGKGPLSYNNSYGAKKKWTPPTKYQKVIPSKLVLHIYNKQYSHLRTAIGKMISGTFFFGMEIIQLFYTPQRRE